jgi:hypothetical protein
MLHLTNHSPSLLFTSLTHMNCFLDLPDDDVTEIHRIPLDEERSEEGRSRDEPPHDNASDDSEDDTGGLPPGLYRVRGVLRAKYHRGRLQARVDWHPSWATEHEFSYHLRRGRVMDHCRRHGRTELLIDWRPTWTPLTKQFPPRCTELQNSLRDLRAFQWDLS